PEDAQPQREGNNHDKVAGGIGASHIQKRAEISRTGVSVSTTVDAIIILLGTDRRVSNAAWHETPRSLAHQRTESTADYPSIDGAGNFFCIAIATVPQTTL